MNEFIKALTTLNNICELLNIHSEAKYSIVDWIFGFIVFKGEERVFDGNFVAVAEYLINEMKTEH